MKNNFSFRSKSFLIILGIVFATCFIWFFFKIVTYILIAAVLSFLSHPITRNLEKIHFKNIYLPRVIVAILTMFGFYGGIFTVLYLLIPMLAKELHVLSEIDKTLIENRMSDLLNFIDGFAARYNFTEASGQIKQSIINYLNKQFYFSNISETAQQLFSITGSFIAGFFAVSFIYFFFLMDKLLFTNIITGALPVEFEENARIVLKNTKRMLGQYLRGLAIDMFIVGLLVGLGLYIIGVKSILVIAIVSGVLNIIPYLGPIIALVFGVILSVAGSNTLIDFSTLPVFVIKVSSIFISVQLLDGLIFQPYIFSSTVKAHPLEVFLVILMAGSIGGIILMIFALPLYIVIRIFAKEFFFKYKIVQQLTKNL